MERRAKEASDAALGGDALALSRLYLLKNEAALLERPRLLEATLDQIRKAPRADALTRAHAAHLLAGFLRARGDLAAASEVLDGLMIVRQGMLLGPFENSAGAGHREVYPPEERLDLDVDVAGKSRSIRWRPLGEAAGTGVVIPGAVLHDAADSTAYLLFGVEAKADTQGAIRVGSKDAVKVFLDGRGILDVDQSRGAHLDQDVVPVVFGRGTSLVLVKTSWSGAEGALIVRVSAPNGGPLSGVRLVSEPSALRQAAKEARRPARPAPHRAVGVTDAIDQAVKKGSGQALGEALALRSNLTAVLELYDARKLPTPPLVDLDRAIRAAPDRPMIRFFYGVRSERSDRSVAREQLEAAVASDPGHAPALARLADLSAATGLSLDAKRMLRQALAKDPALDLARVALARAMAENHLDQLHALALLLDSPPDQRGPHLWTAIARAQFDQGDRPSATAAAQRALALDPLAGGARDLLLRMAIDAGRTDEALRLTEEQIRIAPHAIGPRLRQARLLAAGGDAAAIARARAEVARLAATFGENTTLAELEAELALEEGKKDEAILALDRSLEIDPHQRGALRHRAALTGGGDELEDRFTADAAGMLDAPISTMEGSWGAAYLLERTAVRLYESGQSTRFVQTVVRMQKPELRDLLRVDQIRYSPSREHVEVLSAERIKPNGEVIKASRVDDRGTGGKIAGMYVDQRWKSVEFDELEAGDILHLRYRIDSTGPNIFGGFFGDVAGVEGRWPKVRFEHVTLSPKGRPLYPGVLRSVPPKVTEEGSLVRTAWTFEDVPPIDAEPMLPPYADIAATLSVSTYERWEDLGRWYANLFRDQLELDDAARAAGKNAIAGATSEAEKISRLYNYVVQNTRYVGIELGIHGWKPFKASEVHRRRYGDCKDKATLLAALLRDNGIEATIALVRTSDRGSFPREHASMWAFNHAITYVPSAELYLDGTAEYSGSGELPWQDQGAFVLVVFPDGRVKLDSPPEAAPQENLNRSSYRAVLQKDGSLDLEGTESFFGARASSLRQEYAEPRTRGQQVEKSLSEVAPGAEVQGFEFSELADLDKAPSYHYEARLPRYAEADGPRWILPLTLFPHRVASAYATLASRRYPLYTQHAWSTRNVIEYRLPEGATIEALPEGINLDTTFISLEQRIERTKDGFVTDDTVTLKARMVPPEAYAEFRAACLAIDRALERKVEVRR